MSITFWVPLFLPSQFIGLPLSRVAYGVVLGASVAVAWQLGRRPVRLGVNHESLAASVALGLAVALGLEAVTAPADVVEAMLQL